MRGCVAHNGLLTLTSIIKVIKLWLYNKTAKICHISCSVYNTYSSGWIISIFCTNDHWHERMCRVQRPLILIYIFKVFQPWLCNETAKIWYIFSCPLYSTYSCGWIVFIFGTNDHYHDDVCQLVKRQGDANSCGRGEGYLSRSSIYNFHL